MKRFYWFLLLLLTLSTTHAQENTHIYLPLITTPAEATEPPPAMVEFRGIWITRFDWTSDPTPQKIEEIVQNVASAGFNVLLFQVRGEADAFYNSNLEPWSRRLTGTLGQNPGWDPLAHLIQTAHTHGLKVHAYINVYPVWTGCAPPPSNTSPQHFYYTLLNAHGQTDGKNNGLQWATNGEVDCGSYQRATPASIVGDDHYLAVAHDLLSRYALDGLHLDHIRYSGTNSSCDPVSQQFYGAPCFGFNGQMAYDNWQRRQVNGTVSKFYQQVQTYERGVWLSTAVWPIHTEKPEWGWGNFAKQGYFDYYQDSKTWAQDGYVDAIMPMIYPGGATHCPDDSFWSQDKWETLVRDFVAESGDRMIFPGIGTSYCTFDEIAMRITLAREIGTGGHTLFSYSGLYHNNYFEALANGPYAQPATPPTVTWHP